MNPVIRFELHRREEGDWVVWFKRSIGVDGEGCHIFRTVTVTMLRGYREVPRWMWGCICRCADSLPSRGGKQR